MLNVTINVSFLQLPGRGRSGHPGHYICVFMARKRGTRPLCSLQQVSWKTFFPPFSSVWLHFHLSNGGCALTFAGINLLVYLDFSNLICLNEIIKQPLLWPNLSQTGIVIIGYPSKQSSPKARLHQQQ